MTDLADIIGRLAAASVIGGVIGINRNLHGKPTGLRTLALVGLGAATMVLVATESSSDPGSVSRVLQGLLTGIGFLGAGVILHDAGQQKVLGLTTAATIWVTACLGAACGIGAWRIVIAAASIVAVLLILGGPLEKAIHRRLHGPKGSDGDHQS